MKISILFKFYLFLFLFFLLKAREVYAGCVGDDEICERQKWGETILFGFILLSLKYIFLLTFFIIAIIAIHRLFRQRKIKKV